MAQHEAALAGIRVLDFSRVLAGPYATQTLAEMGADVVKVEWSRGDSSRQVGPFLGGRSLYFSSVNGGKRSVLLDPGVPADADRIADLIRVTDVVVENFRPETAVELGLDRDRIRRLNPSAIVVTISGYAAGVEPATRPAYDLAIQAEAGVMSLTGTPGQAPVRAGVPISDLAAGLWAALAVTAGLLRRARTGRGSHVEVPLLDATLPLLSYVATAALHEGTEPVKVGSGHHNACPYGAFEAADGWVVVAVLADKFWPAVCEALTLRELRDRADLRELAGRLAQRDLVDRAVGEAIAPMTVVEAGEALRTAGVPTAPVRGVLEALDSPYVRARGLVREYATPQGTYRVVRSPIQEVELSAAPDLGADTEDVLASWTRDVRDVRDAEVRS